MTDSTRHSDSESRSDSTRRAFLRRAAAATTTTAAVALAGCAGAFTGGEETAPEDYSLPAANASVEVTMGDGGADEFTPEIARVETGGTVTWTNASGRHSATAYASENDQPRRIPEDAESWDSTVLTGPDESFSHTFETPGVYDYYCTPHEALGMVGTVVVGDPGTADQPGLASPGDDLPRGARNKLETLNAKVQSALEE